MTAIMLILMRFYATSTYPNYMAVSDYEDNVFLIILLL